MERDRASVEYQHRQYVEQMMKLNAEMVADACRMNEAPIAQGDVIDLVPVADGVYGVPAALEYRVRT